MVKAALKIHPEAPTVRQVGQAQLAGGRCLVFLGGNIRAEGEGIRHSVYIYIYILGIVIVHIFFVKNFYSHRLESKYLV